MSKTAQRLHKLGLSVVNKHHGQKYLFDGIEFDAVASPPELTFGPGPIGFTRGREYAVKLRTDRNAFGSRLPGKGSAFIDPDGKRIVVDSMSIMPGGHSIQFYCRIDNY